MNRLHVIQEEIQVRAKEITSRQDDWPCRKGCDECCRKLASVPLITEEEWRLVAAALNSPAETAELARRRIRDSVNLSRPVVCPLLDISSGSCLIYDARPLACRAYGFYVKRQNVLGCSRIESIADESSEIVWGNHTVLEKRIHRLGPAAELHQWLTSESDA